MIAALPGGQMQSRYVRVETQKKKKGLSHLCRVRILVPMIESNAFTLELAKREVILINYLLWIKLLHLLIIYYSITLLFLAYWSNSKLAIKDTYEKEIAR